MSDGDRFGGFQRTIPGRPILADFDGLCDDGWIFEAKSPTQMRFEQIEAEGVDEYYQVQAHHLTGVAHYTETLPGIADKAEFLRTTGGIKGTRIVFYAPEEIRLHVVEIPFDQKLTDKILDTCEEWWNTHITGNVPPIEPFAKQVRLQKTTGLYTQVDGEWEEVLAELMTARRMAEEAGAVAKEKETFLKGVIDDMKLEKVMLPSGTKISYSFQDGKKTLDIKALQATHPELDLEQFYRVGAPFKTFRIYEKGEKKKNMD
jgi:predicted phage-related endonuclease